MTAQNSQPLSSRESANLFDSKRQKRYQLDKLFAALTWTATFVALLILVVLLADVLIDGVAQVNWSFIVSDISPRPTRAGIFQALVGSIWLLGLTALISFPLGVGTGIYLEEFAADSFLAKVVEINISNLAGVPAIIYGLLGLGIFVNLLRPLTGGNSIISGALTMSLLILPIIIVSTREALRSVPDSTRLAGLALGATLWQTIRSHVFPVALPGILTGTILALSRAIGEAAPLIVIGAAGYIAFTPDNLQSRFTALPVLIYRWIDDPKDLFHDKAAAAIIVLMIVLVTMNATAIILRNKFQNQGR
ncbi:MAG: phosphate ABC transporter permease PstA [Spirulinaceae cyanobacterium]